MLITCFISHAWDEGGHDFAKRLVSALRAKRVKAWLDEEEVLAGELLEQEIRKGVSFECDVFLFVLSPPALESRGCAIELKEALRRRDEIGVQIIPVWFRDCKFPSELKGLMYEDFRDPAHFDQSIKHLLASVRLAGRIRALVSQLLDGESAARSRAALKLGNLRNPLTAPILIRRLSTDCDASVRHWVAYALGKIGTSEALNALCEAKKKEINPFTLLGIENALQEERSSIDS